MNAEIRRKLEMGMRALNFSQAHPDASAGYTAALGRLDERIARALALATQQRTGVIAVRTATARKRELRATLQSALLNHLARVAEVASREEPELARKFQLPRDNGSYQAFRTAARAIADEAQARKELLVRYGLSEPLLESLEQALDQFDEALDAGNAGRRAHVGARAELDAVLAEVVQLVHVMDGLNRYRFAKDVEQLAAWESARNVITPTHTNGATPTPVDGGGPAGGEVKPAA